MQAITGGQPQYMGIPLPLSLTTLTAIVSPSALAALGHTLSASSSLTAHGCTCFCCSDHLLSDITQPLSAPPVVGLLYWLFEGCGAYSLCTKWLLSDMT